MWGIMVSLSFHVQGFQIWMVGTLTDDCDGVSVMGLGDWSISLFRIAKSILYGEVYAITVYIQLSYTL